VAGTVGRRSSVSAIHVEDVTDTTEGQTVSGRKLLFEYGCQAQIRAVPRGRGGARDVAPLGGRERLRAAAGYVDVDERPDELERP
jgi:hypothetical protein